MLLGGYDWNWGGCSDNVRVGERAAKKLLDTLITKRDGAAAMHLHNNMAGRKVRKPVTMMQHDLVFKIGVLLSIYCFAIPFAGSNKNNEICV